METSQELALIPIWCETGRGAGLSRKRKAARKWLRMCSQVAERSTAALRSVDRCRQKGQKGGFWLRVVDRWPHSGRPLTAAEGMVQRRKGLSSRRQGLDKLKDVRGVVEEL